jgi:Cu(I)/Ag(I) efflux system membrane fusion protein
MKGIITISLLFYVLIMTACNQPAKQEQQEKQGDQGVLQAPYAAQFYDSLQVTMETYYDLTEGLTEGNITYADKWAGLLKQHIDSLPLHILQMDSSRLEQMKTNAGSISSELAGMQGEKTMENKRAAFEMVSDMLYDLVKTTGLKGKTIYRQYCPMAFNDRGAYWISRSTRRQNPYFGKDMLSCVQVTDSLKY